MPPNTANIEQNEVDIEKNQLEKDQLEKDQLEKDQLEKVQLEKDLLEKDQLEKDHLEKDQLEKDQFEKDQLEKDQLEKDQLEKEQLEKDQLEKDQLEKEQLEKDQSEKNQLEKEQLEKDQLEKDQLEKEQLEKDKLEKDQLEKDQLEKDQLEKDQLEKDQLENDELEYQAVAPQTSPRKNDIVIFNIFLFLYWHVAAVYGVYLCVTSAKWQTLALMYAFFVLAELGITAGAHRLWSHKSYKAKLPLQIILMLMNTLAFQNTAIDWVRDHRLHHKYSDTDADPHNATRGFFFSHVGWLLVRKHPEVKRRGKMLDMSDISGNPVLMFQKRYAVPMFSMICFVMPTLLPMYLWGESLNNAWHLTLMRYVANLNATLLVNSAAHRWGYKTYDKAILPSQNISVSIATLGDGFHNYHHTFPWDYRSAELGNNILNVTKKFIDFFAYLGWAYDLKTAPNAMLKSRAKRTGDGTNLWGWGDKEMSGEDQINVEVLYQKTE